MTDYTDLLALVVSKTGYATPVTGGDDPVSDNEIIEYLNDAFSHLTKGLGGHEKYVRFTITAAGVITVTVPALPLVQPSITLVTPALVSLPSYKISDAYKIIQIENMTANMINTADRVLYRIPYDQRQYALAFEDSDTYYRWVDGQARRGIVLLPKTITLENDLAVTYGGKFTRYAVGAVEFFTGAGLNDLTRNAAVNFTGNDGSTKTFWVRIDHGDPINPNTFEWSNDGGVTWEAHDVPITGTAQTLEDGFTITFGAIIGHTTNNAWRWTATAPSLNYYEDEEMREYPVEYAAAMTMKDLKQVEWTDSYGYAQSLLKKFFRDRENEDMGSYYSMRD